MKKSIIALLIIAITWSTVGCGLYVDKDALKDKTNEIVEGAVDEATQKVEETVDNAVTQTEQRLTNAWGNLIGCNHEPKNYKKKQNTVFCRCGANKFDALEYDEFASCVSFWDKGFKNKEKYCVKAYVQYKGVDPIFFELAEKLEKKGKIKSEQLEELKGLGNLLTGTLGDALDVNEFYAKLVQDTEAEKLIGTTNDFTSLLGMTIQITVVAHRLSENNEDPAVFCKEFLDGITEIVDGMSFPVLAVKLKLLAPTYEKYVERLADNLFQYETGWSSINNSVFGAEGWEQFENKANWEEELKTVKGLEGTEFLPSLEEVMINYDDCDEKGKLLLDEYILFRLDKYFEEIMGVTFEEYVECFGE